MREKHTRAAVRMRGRHRTVATRGWMAAKFNRSYELLDARCAHMEACLGSITSLLEAMAHNGAV